MDDIILYSTGCPKCNVLKKKLDEKGVQYKLNTSEEDILKLGVLSVPLLSINGRLLDFGKSIAWVNGI